MNVFWKACGYGLTTLPLAWALALPAKAQSIVPTNDGTGTIVNQDGTQYTIQGGQFSGDGRNQFHSLDTFNVLQGETATFLTPAGIENVLTRVVGGDPSYINGLVQMLGSDANLYLINPAGLVFGASASLNVSGDFIATTATHIGLDSNTQLNAIGANNWSELIGTPTSFTFALANPGAIVNLGNLVVPIGQNLGLFGGTTLNLGTLQAPGGTISVAAVPGESLVRLSSPGNLLSLEVQSGQLPNREASATTLNPLTVPEMLTGGNTELAQRISVNPDGTINLLGTGQSIALEPGTNVVSGQVSVRHTDANATTPPAVGLLGDRVMLLGANVDASAAAGGGNIFIGGDFQGNGTLPNAQHLYVDGNSNILADSLLRGDGGQVILWSDNTTQFFGSISARGAAFLPGGEASNGGFVEVSSKGWLNFQGGVDTSAPNGSMGTLLLDPTNIYVVSDDVETSDLNDVDQAGDPDIEVPTPDPTPTPDPSPDPDTSPTPDPSPDPAPQPDATPDVQETAL